MNTPAQASVAPRWVTDHLVDAIFAMVVLTSGAYWVRLTRGSWFLADDWLYAVQGRQAGQLLQPYNGHLSITILGLYRVLLETVGFTSFTPYRVIGIVSFASVAVGMFLINRRLVGAPLAAIMGLLLLWFRGLSLEPGGLNHSLALLGAVVCAYGLNGTGRRRDIAVAGGLAFALCAAGDGVAAAVGAIVFLACVRAEWRRWVAVLVPSALWALWYGIVVIGGGETQSAPFGLVETVRRASEQARRSFAYLALGNRAVGWVLFIAFVAYGLWLLRKGLDASANLLAWSAALGFWWVGVVRARYLLLGVPTFRYEFVSVGFILLALRPRHRIPWERWTADRGSELVRSLAGAAVVVVVAILLIASVRPDVRTFSMQQANFAKKIKGNVALALHGPRPLPDATRFGFYLGGLTASQIRALAEAYPGP